MFTIFGASGFIGSHLVAYLEAQGHEVYSVPREVQHIPRDKDLGAIIYCVGLTADYRGKPYQTVEAHVSLLSYILQNLNYSSLLYLSSTRVYQGSKEGKENSDVTVNSSHLGDIYNLSKLLGESICLNTTHKIVRVARLSNVFGKGMHRDNFLWDITRHAASNQQIHLRTSIQSEKDYISVGEAVPLLQQISTNGIHKIYNVATGVNTSTKQIIDILEKNYQFKLSIEPEAQMHCFPKIDITKIKTEFSYTPIPFQESYRKFLLETTA